MEPQIIAMIAALMFVGALLYTSVGHAGASAYLAIMALFSVAPSTMRPTALVLNIIVAAFAAWRYADPAGFEQITYGDFTGPYFIQDPIGARREFIKLWQDQPHRDLPFRFGYPDQDKHNHLLVTRPKRSAAN